MKSHGEGPKNKRCKLNQRQVDEIRASPLGLKALSEKYGVSRNQIYLIRTRQNWKV